MDKHMVAGLAFAAIPAGYALSRVTLPKLQPRAVFALAAAVIAIPAVTGAWYARNTYHDWPNVSRLISSMKQAAANDRADPILIDSNGNFSIFLFDYYLMHGDRWQQIQATPGGHALPSGERYSVIAADFNASLLNNPGLPKVALHGTPTMASEVLHLAGNDALARALTASHRYRIFAIIPYQTASQNNSSGVFVIWQRTDSSGQR